MTEGDKSGFLGRGWSFPPRFDVNTKQVAMVERELDIQQSLHILLTTALGERVMQPKYGCDMEDYLFESMNTTTKTLIIDRIRKAILFFEPRIEANRITLNDAEQQAGLLEIEIDYVVHATNSRLNFVFPFYINEGTELGLSAGAFAENG